VGTGSVGTAILFFTTLWTRSFRATLFDRDVVKVENLDRSPIFRNLDVGTLKVSATAGFLHRVGVRNVVPEATWLHESERWANRRAGTPSLAVSAANEHGARYQLEAGFPPLQIYGTTGRNWQATALRHIPMQDACSLCLFPEDAGWGDPTTCGTAQIKQAATGDVVDAALPFLSFGAGLMAAAEIAKSVLGGYPFSPNRVCWNSRTGTFVTAPVPVIPGCICQSRDHQIHRAMLT
jgi:molybdopterin/thiamine biosynthesis adenylyltransferase